MIRFKVFHSTHFIFSKLLIYTHTNQISNTNVSSPVDTVNESKNKLTNVLTNNDVLFIRTKESQIILKAGTGQVNAYHNEISTQIISNLQFVFDESIQEHFKFNDCFSILSTMKKFNIPADRETFLLLSTNLLLIKKSKTLVESNEYKSKITPLKTFYQTYQALLKQEHDSVLYSATINTNEKKN